MEGIGMYEGYTHMANLFLSEIYTGQDSTDKEINLELQEKIWKLLDEEPDTDGGVTRLTTGDLVLRIFAHRAQTLQQLADKIKKLYEAIH